MERLPYSTISEALRTARTDDLPPLRISILRNIVLEPIEAYLRYLALEMGFNAQCRFGQYDNVFQEAVGGCPELLNEMTDCVLVFLRLETLAWDLARTPLSLSPTQLASERARVEDFVSAVLEGLRRQTPALILWHAFERPLHPALGILDAQDPAGQAAAIQELNDFVRDRLRRWPSAYFVDLNACVARVGAHAFYDARYWHIGKAPYSRQGLAEIADEVFRYLRPLEGKNKKCVVLDCDGVLWGGILGEDGFDGIKLGPTYPGSMYHELQQELLNLHGRGVLLALCSKNNAEEVWEVFERHPGMILRREHIAAARINWDDKASNLRQIAAELNLGLDSLVFLDDNEVEVELVRQLLPAVHVLHLPADRAVEYRDRLLAYGWCDTLTLSHEDRRRTAMYRAEQARHQLRGSSSDLDGYYRSLAMVLEVRFADAFSIPRIAQLTQKTNQFNLTTRRYGEAEVQQLSSRDDVDVIAVRLRDRFGDSGLVGVCILHYAEQQAVFDTFLLSCRALGRGVEDAMLVQCLARVRARHCRTAIGEYRPTAKNAQVEEFYARHGFRRVPGDTTTHRFLIDVTAATEPEPAFFARIDSEIMTGKGAAGAAAPLEEQP
jgi:FkbH-like protein